MLTCTAVADSLAAIRRDWAELERDVMGPVRKNNAKDSKEEICDFLLVKFDRWVAWTAAEAKERG